MIKTLYLGFDESYGTGNKENSVLVVCPSVSPPEIYGTGKFEKKRHLEREALEQDFLYVRERESTIRSNGPLLCVALAHEGIRRYGQGYNQVELLLDGEKIWGNGFLEQLCLHPMIDPEGVSLIPQGDTRLELLNKADHLAHTLRTIHSTRKVNQDRVKRIFGDPDRVRDYLERFRV